MMTRQVDVESTAVFTAVMTEAPADGSTLERSWASLPDEIVDGGEMIVLAIKPSMWRPVFDSMPWLIMAAVLGVTLTAMGKPIPGLPVSLAVQIVLVLGVARLGIAIIRWVPTWYVLTNRRVMCVHGVRAPKVHSLALIEVRNTYLNATAPEKLIGLGTISLVSDEPNHAPLIWISITRPREIHEKIRRAIQNAIDQHVL
ncbi:MAG: PH domain-containing protein [Planctomycetes bacterium]|nr:PH domain-containing protein [Planctomycetota bacterium]